MTKPLAKCELCEKEHSFSPTGNFQLLDIPPECPLNILRLVDDVDIKESWNRLQAAIKKAKGKAFDEGNGYAFKGIAEGY